MEVQGAHKPSRHAPGGGTPQACGLWVDPLWLILASVFLYIPKIISIDFQVIPGTFISAQK